VLQPKTIKLASDLQICRILNGMWQVAGGHGQINQESAISEMLQYHEAGLTSWDMADIYGPAEEFLGQFRKKLAVLTKLAQARKTLSDITEPKKILELRESINKELARISETEFLMGVRRKEIDYNKL